MSPDSSLRLAHAYLLSLAEHPQDLGQPPEQVERQADESVTYPVTLCRRYRDLLDGRRILIDADRDTQPLVEHELMKALHCPRCPCLDLHRDDAPDELDQKVDLSRPSAFSLPVEQFWTFTFGVLQEAQLLARNLFCKRGPDRR